MELQWKWTKYEANFKYSRKKKVSPSLRIGLLCFFEVQEQQTGTTFAFYLTDPIQSQAHCSFSYFPSPIAFLSFPQGHCLHLHSAPYGITASKHKWKMNPLLQRDAALRLRRARTGSWWMLGCYSLDMVQTLQLTDSNASLSITEVTFLLPTCTLALCPSFPPCTFKRAQNCSLTSLESHSRPFPGSTPPIHFAKPREDYNSISISILFFPRKSENELMFFTSSIPHWCRALEPKC